MWCSEWPRGIPGEWELGSGQKKSIQNQGAKMKSTAQDRTQASRRVWVYYTIGDGTQTQHHHKLHACCVATTGQLIVSCAPCATATRQHPGEACTIGYERELQYHSHRSRGPKTNGRTWP